MANEIPIFTTTRSTAPSLYSFGVDNAHSKLATQFVVGTNGVKLSKVNAYLSLIGSPTDYIICEIYSDSTDSTPDTLLATSEQVFISSAGYYVFSFSGAEQIELEEGSYYWAVFRRTGPIDDSNYYRLGYRSGSNQMPGGFLRYDSSVPEWVAVSTSYMALIDIYGLHDNKFNVLHCNFVYTSDYIDIFSGTTYFAIGQHFKTPSAPSGGKIRIKHVGMGHGQVGSWSGTPGDGDYRVEFHKYGAGALDFSENSSTRIGKPSEWIPRDLPYTRNNAYYYHQTFRHVNWAFEEEPELDGNTEYYVVFVPKNVGDGRHRYAECDDDSLGGYEAYRFSNLGGATSTGAGETLTCLIINGYESAVINKDIIIPWTIVDLDIRTIDSDIILPWLLSEYLEKDLIFKWKIKEDWELTLNWDLREDIIKDSILRWKILNEAQYDFLLRWGLLVEADFTLPWVLRPLITHDFILPIPIRMDTDFILQWGFNYQVTNDVIFRWIIDSRIWRDVALKYHIKVETDHILLIPLRAQVNKDVIIKSRLTSDIVADNVLRFNIREFNQVDADNKLRWVLEGRPRFYKITFT